MGVLMSGIAAAIVLGVIAAVALSIAQQPSYEAYSSSSTRIAEPGSNLVGEQWTGNPKVGADSGTAAAESRAGSQ